MACAAPPALIGSRKERQQPVGWHSRGFVEAPQVRSRSDGFVGATRVVPFGQRRNLESRWCASFVRRRVAGASQREGCVRSAVRAHGRPRNLDRGRDASSQGIDQSQRVRRAGRRAPCSGRSRVRHEVCHRHSRRTGRLRRPGHPSSGYGLSPARPVHQVQLCSVWPDGTPLSAASARPIPRVRRGRLLQARKRRPRQGVVRACLRAGSTASRSPSCSFEAGLDTQVSCSCTMAIGRIFALHIGKSR